MGYYTTHNLSVTAGNEDLIEKLRQENQNAHYAFDEFGSEQESLKWYDHEEDMRAFSQKHPNVLFTLEGVGEEQPDMWIEYYKNGMMQRTVARIEFDDFDESLLN